MKAALILLIALETVVAQNCNSQYGSYLNCIKGKLDSDYGKYEREFGEDYKKLVFNCFSTNPSDAQNGRACVMKDITALQGAFDQDGPLGECSFCYKLAQQIKKLFLDAPEKSLKCIRTTVSEAIGGEIGKCIQKRESGFRMPELPDFDDKSQPYRQQMIDNTGAFIQADYLLDRCERNSDRRQGGGRGKRSAYSNSNSCIESRKINGSAIWSEHCSAITSCHNSVPSSCKSDFSRVEGYACQCINDGRDELQELIKVNGRKLVDIAKSSSQGSDSCRSSVANADFALVEWKQCKCKALATEIIEKNSDRIDVKAVFSKVLDCTEMSPQQRELVSLDKLLTLGCRRVAQNGNEGLRAAAELATGLDFVAKLLDALVERVTRFCPNSSCRP